MEAMQATAGMLVDQDLLEINPRTSFPEGTQIAVY